MKTTLMPLAAALAACATVQAAPHHEGSAALGQATYIDGLIVTPEQVIEDSRCPADVTCIWAGRVILRATVAGGSWERTMELTWGEPVAIADGSLTLTAVEPPRVSTADIEPGDYRFAFEFDGGF